MQPRDQGKVVQEGLNLQQMPCPPQQTDLLSLGRERALRSLQCALLCSLGTKHCKACACVRWHVPCAAWLPNNSVWLSSLMA